MPNIMTRNNRKLTPNPDRKYDIIVKIAYKDIDSVEIKLPDGYTTESIPQDITLQNQFGKYNSSVKLIGNTLFYYRSIERYTGRFPAKDFDALVSFYQAIYKTDRNKVVLVKNAE